MSNSKSTSKAKAQLSRLQDFTARLDDDAQFLTGVVAIYETGNDNAALRAALSPSYEARTYNSLLYILARSASAAVGRALETPRQDRASIPTIIKGVIAPDILKLIRANAREWPAKEFADKNERRALSSLREAIRLHRLIDIQTRNKLRNFRNQHDAHLLVFGKRKPLPTYDDVIATAKSVVLITHNLSFAIRGHYMDVSENDQVFREHASSFWSRLKNGTPDEQYQLS